MFEMLLQSQEGMRLGWGPGAGWTGSAERREAAAWNSQRVCWALSGAGEGGTGDLQANERPKAGELGVSWGTGDSRSGEKGGRYMGRFFFKYICVFGSGPVASLWPAQVLPTPP